MFSLKVGKNGQPSNLHVVLEFKATVTYVACYSRLLRQEATQNIPKQKDQKAEL